MWVTWGRCYYALAAEQHCVGLRVVVSDAHLTGPGGPVDAIPTKTPFRYIQLVGRSSSFFRHLRHVLLTVFSLRALFPNLPMFVEARSMVSLLLIACIHLFVISFTWCALSGSSFSFILLSFLSLHIRYAVSDTRILYSLFFPTSGLPSFLNDASPHPSTSPRFIGISVGCLFFHSSLHCEKHSD